MVRVGVDFGTTNSVVAVIDETGCHVAHHRLVTSAGPEIVEPIFPSLVARDVTDPGRLLFGLAAEALGRRATQRVRRSIKRELCAFHVGSTIDIADRTENLREVLTSLLADLRRSLLDGLDLDDDEELSVVATVPANANGAQRWVTRRALVDAGWSRHPRLMDEPSAAAIEFVGRALRRRRGLPPEPTTILIYDLGGGTFDASLVRVEGDRVEVLANGGIWQLGGDDFDTILAELVAEGLGLQLDELSPLQHRNLMAECRRSKESLSAYPRPPRSIMISLRDQGIAGRNGSVATISVSEYESRLDSLLNSTLEVVDEVLEGASFAPDRVYLVGGSTLLPAVGRRLTARFPTVVRGTRPFESIAVGAALSHDLSPGRLTHRLARHFGVLRVGGDDHGWEYMDVLFPRGSKLPLPGQVALVQRGPYQPHFDIGVLQYLECSTVTRDGRPGRNRRDWQVIRFPYDSSISGLGRNRDSNDAAVRRCDGLQTTITEEYLLDPDGIVSVRIRRLPDGYAEFHEVCG